jgi:hypothetical protein
MDFSLNADQDLEQPYAMGYGFLLQEMGYEVIVHFHTLQTEHSIKSINL